MSDPFQDCLREFADNFLANNSPHVVKNEIRIIDIVDRKMRKKMIRRFAAAGIDPDKVVLHPDGEATLHAEDGSMATVGTVVFSRSNWPTF